MPQLGAAGKRARTKGERLSSRKGVPPPQTDKRNNAVPGSFLDERLRPSSQRTYRRRFSPVRWQSLSSRARVQLVRRCRRMSGSLWSSLSQAKLAVRFVPKRCKLKAVVRTSVSSPLLADGRICCALLRQAGEGFLSLYHPKGQRTSCENEVVKGLVRARKLGPKRGAGSRSPTVNGAILRASFRDPKSAPE